MHFHVVYKWSRKTVKKRRIFWQIKSIQGIVFFFWSQFNCLLFPELINMEQIAKFYNYTLKTGIGSIVKQLTWTFQHLNPEVSHKKVY